MYVDMEHHVTCRSAGITATSPRQIFPFITLFPAGNGKPAFVYFNAFNLGPPTAATEAYFQQVATYAAPR